MSTIFTSLGSRALRGVPDFTHSALTYAATSLLRCTQTRFSSLTPDRARIFDAARRAADLLGEAAISADHIPAVQSEFVSKLIAARDAEAGPRASEAAHPASMQSMEIAKRSGNGRIREDPAGGTEAAAVVAPAGPPSGISPNAIFNRPPEAIDFEMFARALNVDHSLTPWPPMPFNTAASTRMNAMSTAPNLMYGGDDTVPRYVGVADNVASGGGDSHGLHGWDAAAPYQAHNNQHQDFAASSNAMPYANFADGDIGPGGPILGSSSSSSSIPLGLESWVAHQGLNLSSSGLGPGVGDFIGMGMSEGDGMGFVNEAFWQTILDGHGS